MTVNAKVVFPAPPPTTNALTAQQRTQLLRRTKKIEQILGSTPRLLDTSFETIGPIHVSLHSGFSTQRLTKGHRVSIDSTSSKSSSEVSPLSSPLRRSTSIASTAQSRRRSSTYSNAQEKWPTDSKKIPFLRLAMKSLSLETIPASPPPTRTSFASAQSISIDCFDCSQDQQEQNRDSQKYTLTPTDEPSSPRNSAFLPTTFTIPSTNSLRKQKMDRLRRKLGSDVPLELVFPNSDMDSDEDDRSSGSTASDISPLSSPVRSIAHGRVSRVPSSVSESIEKDDFPPPVPKKSTPRIINARDSLLDIHQAKRSSSKHKPRYRRMRFASAPPPVPISDFKRVKERLSFIVESPDELGHGFGLSLSRVSTSSTEEEDESLDFQPNWSFGTAELSNDIWNTRKAYDDECISPLSTCSESTPPTSPMSPSSPSVIKKRPSSYRKPPPLIVDDC